MKKIPFDLERALDGDLCVNDSGDNFKLVYKSDMKGHLKRDYPLLFVVNSGSKNEFEDWYPINPDNLYMKPKKKTYWANVYKQPLNNNPLFVSHVYSSWEEAEDHKNHNQFIKTISF